MSRVPAADSLLAFVLDFCNTYDLLEDPPDRLSIPLVDRVAERHGVPGFGLRAADLEPVRVVRNELYGVFAAESPAAQVEILNRLLSTYGAVPRLVIGSGASLSGDGVRVAATGGDSPVARLAVAAADALARAVADGSADRLRTCLGDPCRCVYVDRTKANRQRYCCELCNDRMASAAYRRRNR
ncbi:CGNR zinc finger domain-containing protein [Kribbella qitaiheensis]|nr:CGNR zinc finger domain-containing protein [Kribbella qitaiheensis]